MHGNMLMCDCTGDCSQNIHKNVFISFTTLEREVTSAVEILGELS